MVSLSVNELLVWRNSKCLSESQRDATGILPIAFNNYCIAILIQVDTNTTFFIAVSHFCNC